MTVTTNIKSIVICVVLVLWMLLYIDTYIPGKGTHRFVCYPSKKRNHKIITTRKKGGEYNP